MRQINVGEAFFSVDETGEGEVVVFIHGVLVADAFRPLFGEPALTKRYRLVAYRRRGYEGSTPIEATPTVADQAEDCRALMQQLGLGEAHIVGHSFGGAVALQLALDHPECVRSLALLEPALMVGESGPGYREALENGIRQFASQEPDQVVEAMLAARWPQFREGMEKVIPGAYEQAVRDASACFRHELPALLDWSFGDEEAGRISQPVLSVIGEESGKLSPRFEEVHQWLLSRLEEVEGFVLPGAHHFLQAENPSEMAPALAAHFGKHAD